MKIIISALIIILLFFSTPLWAIDLQNASLKELINQRPDLVQDIKSGKDEGTTIVSIVKDAKGRVSIWTEERKDLDGVVIGKRIDKYTYYSTDEINEITQEEYKGVKLTMTLNQKVKHYRDGTQPDIISIDILAKGKI